jgi:hypothetical protein
MEQRKATGKATGRRVSGRFLVLASVSFVAERSKTH